MPTWPIAQNGANRPPSSSARAEAPRAARWPPRPAPACMRSVPGPEATEPPRGGSCGCSCRRRCTATGADNCVGNRHMRRKSCNRPQRSRSACAMVPTLAGVVGVDSRWTPSARPRRAMPDCMCTHCVDCPGVETVRTVSEVYWAVRWRWARLVWAWRAQGGDRERLSRVRSVRGSPGPCARLGLLVALAPHACDTCAGIARAGNRAQGPMSGVVAWCGKRGC